jgi:hypothetical protein
MAITYVHHTIKGDIACLVEENSDPTGYHFRLDMPFQGDDETAGLHALDHGIDLTDMPEDSVFFRRIVNIHHSQEKDLTSITVFAGLDI